MSESISDCIHDSVWIRIYDSVYHSIYDSINIDINIDIDIEVLATNTVKPNVLTPIEEHIRELIEKINDEKHE